MSLQIFTTDSVAVVRSKLAIALTHISDLKLLRRGLRTFEFNGFQAGRTMAQACFIACMYDDDPTLLMRELECGAVLIGQEEVYAAHVMGLNVEAVRCLSTAHYNQPSLLHETVTDRLMSCGLVSRHA